MKYWHIILCLCSILILGACDKKQDGLVGLDTAYVFYPRPCEDILLAVNSLQGSILHSDSMELLLMTGQDPERFYNPNNSRRHPVTFFKYKQPYDLNRKGSVEGIFWYNHHNKAPLSPYNDRLEQELELDVSTKSRARSLDASSSGVAYTNLVSIQYRTTGVRDIKVTTDKELFNVPAGQSLNEYLRIVDMSPRQIISSESERLLIGYQSKHRVTELSEWLSLKPMAQPGMWLSFKTTPEELSDTPMDVKFTVELTTNEGVVLTDTLDVKLVR